MNTKAIAIAYLSALVFLHACVGASDSPPGNESLATSPGADPTPLIVSPRAAETGSPTETADSATAPVLVAPSRIPVARPTPSLVPLPAVCLLPEFAHEVEDCGEIPRYEVRLAIDPAAARVTGRQEIRYTNLEDRPLSDVYLRLFPNTPGYGGRMAVSRFAVAGRLSLSFTESEGSVLRVPMAPPLAVGQTITLSMDFDVDVPTTNLAGSGLFSYHRGVLALPTVFPLIPVYDDDGWHIQTAPEHGDDIYADVAAFEVQITAPSSMSLAASGACFEEAQDGESTIWVCDAAPMRDFVLILLEDYRVVNRVVEGVVVNSYHRPEHGDGGDLALDVAASALTAFTEMFGAYPYSELDVVATPNLLGGMEYSGLVVIEDGLYARLGGVEWLAAHEVAHQWWFAVVGSDQIDDPWLDEALTQYSTMLYYEHRYGPGRGAGIVNTVFADTNAALVAAGADLPAGLPASAYSPGQYFQVVYDKGALYFHELRQAVGDDVFFEILRTYYRRHRYEIATPGSFLAVVESVAGDPYPGIYEKWIAPNG